MRLLRSLLLLIVLLVAVDFVAKTVAANRLESSLASALSLEEAPQVTIGGFPFLWQAAAGDLTSITVSTDRIRQDSVQLSGVRATFRDVHFELSDAISGDLDRVRIGGGSGRARLSVGVLEDALGAAGGLDISLDDLPGLSVSGRTLTAGPVSVALPALTEGMNYRSARLVDGAIDLRFGFEPSTLRIR